MRVLVINNLGLGMGGITTHMYNYLEKLIVYDVDIDIVSTIEASDEMILKFKSIGCNIFYLSNRKKKLLKYFSELKKIINNNSYDAVHVHGNSATMIIDLWWAFFYKVPVRIAHCHNSTSNYKIFTKIVMPIFSKMYTNAVACSDTAGEWIFGKENFIILHNAINLNEYRFSDNKRKSIRKELSIDDDTFVIGHIGNFNEQKNHDFLIEILNKLATKRKCVLVLIGMGKLQEEIKKKVNDLRLNEKVIFLNIRTDVAELLSAFDVFVMPSRWEGLPVSLIEAQSNELPCYVSTNVSREAQLTELVHFIEDLNNCISWCDELEKVPNRNCYSSNANIYDLITDNGYNIIKESKKLLSIYTNIGY